MVKNFLLFCIVFLLVSAVSFSRDEFSANRFIIGIEADYHNWNSRLSEYEINGNPESDENLDFYNENYDFLFSYYSNSLMAGYDIQDNFQMFVMGGLATIRQETNDLSDDEKVPHDLFLTNDPGYKLTLELVYTYKVGSKLSIVAIPEFTYLAFKDMKVVENTEQSIHNDYDIELGLIDWKVGVYAKYDMKRIRPFIGVLYQDYLKNVNFDGYTVDSFNNKNFVERRMKYNQNLVLAGSVGFRVMLDPDKFFTIRSNVGDGYSVYGSVMFKL